MIPLFSKSRKILTLHFAASPSPLRGKPTQAQDVARHSPPVVGCGRIRTNEVARCAQIWWPGWTTMRPEEECARKVGVGGERRRVARGGWRKTGTCVPDGRASGGHGHTSRSSTRVLFNEKQAFNRLLPLVGPTSRRWIARWRPDYRRRIARWSPSGRRRGSRRRR